MRRIPILAAAALASFLGSSAALAQTGLLVPTSTGRPDPSVLSLDEMAVDVGIARGYARVNVRQVHANHTGDVQEGTWRFRLPESGAVGDFAVWDGLTRIPGVILEKRQARAIYRELTTRRIDPGLLQQGEEEDREPSASGRPGARPSGGAVFSVKVAPIPAWGTKRLELQYQQDVTWVDGVGELRVSLAPGDGEPMVVKRLSVSVTLEDAVFVESSARRLPLTVEGARARFQRTDVPLDRDVVVRFKPASAAPLALAAFRNPDGTLPDGLALAPWERATDVPPEKDGFFLLEFRPEGKPAPGAGKAPAVAKPRPPLAVAILFDTSLSHRWGGLEAGYAHLARLLGRLGRDDRFVLVPFASTAAPDPQGLAPVTEASRQAALAYLRSRPLSPGTAITAAIARAAALLPGDTATSRIVVVTDGAADATGAAKAAAGRPLFAVVTGDERPAGLTAGAAAVLQLPPSGASEAPAEESLFLDQLLADRTRTGKPAPTRAAAPDAPPFTVNGGDPKLRDVYPILTHPPVAGSLSAWVGRYAAPVEKATVTLREEPRPPALAVSFPAKALDARDLPRRWARARVDELLRRIELEGERREWVEEIIALSRRYKFVTPYTAFLAAPRALLRPRRIQPGDPVIRVEADSSIASAVALLPFGARVDLVRRPGTRLWEGRFLVPEGLPDGPLAVRLVLRDHEGRSFVETKRVVVDGTAPTIRPVLPASAAAGDVVRVAARADSDVLFLSARLGDGAPVPLRWDDAAKANVGEVALPQGEAGSQPLFFEAIDGAGNHGFARATLEVR